MNVFDNILESTAYWLFRMRWRWKNRRWKNNHNKRKAYHLACAKWCEQWYRRRYGHEVTKLWQ